MSITLTRYELAEACLFRCVYMLAWHLPEYTKEVELLEEYIETGALRTEVIYTALKACVKNRDIAEDLATYNQKNPLHNCEAGDWDILATVLRKGIRR